MKIPPLAISRRNLYNVALPLVRSEMPSLRHSPVRTSLPVAALLVHLCSPPLEVLHEAWVNKAKEDDDDAKG